ncbi:unnamed protein product [Linum tenue]|uniref:Cytochrome P450 n=1 Tax=Linum tenue TaxID=586396 RepID=A0AAV0RE14_9ROSI|nr:unnamed protein product [Linum tenue]
METTDHHNFLMSSKDTNWYFFTLPAFLGSQTFLGGGGGGDGDAYYLLFSLLAAFLSLAAATWLLTPGGSAWRHGRTSRVPAQIPGPRGLPIFGSLFALSRGLAHRTLASMAWAGPNNKQLMALSLGGSTRLVVSSDPATAREILTSVGFADRPVKRSARSLMFERAIGFAPNGPYWRLLRKIASAHLFSPRRVAAHEPMRQAECAAMLDDVAVEQAARGRVELRPHLQLASLNNIMGSVFGKRYDAVEDKFELDRLEEMVREGFDLLGAFNWSDYLPWLCWFYDPCRINERCAELVPRVRELVRGIIQEHRVRLGGGHVDGGDGSDFVDVLLSLEGEEKLEEDDMIAVLWEMIFRGTDTTALLTEWVMAELVLHPEIQQKLRAELDSIAADLSDADVAKSPYLQAVVKETLRVHPPGPLLSWARLSTSDVQLSNGMVVPAGTTAMVNMWAITHDPEVWSDPLEFRPERFLEKGGDVDVRGGDLRLAPFGAGRRVCPGKNLGMNTVALWVARLVNRFEWKEDSGRPVCLDEVLKLSCEMKHPLHAVVVARK